MCRECHARYMRAWRRGGGGCGTGANVGMDREEESGDGAGLISHGELSRCGQVLMLGLCEGDARLCEAVRAYMAGSIDERKAGRECSMAPSTFRRFAENVRTKLARLLNSGAVEIGELVAA